MRTEVRNLAKCCDSSRRSRESLLGDAERVKEGAVAAGSAREDSAPASTVGGFLSSTPKGRSADPTFPISGLGPSGSPQRDDRGRVVARIAEPYVTGHERTTGQKENDQASGRSAMLVVRPRRA